MKNCSAPRLTAVMVFVFAMVCAGCAGTKGAGAMAHGSSGAQVSLLEGYETSWRALTEVLKEDPTLFAVDPSKTKPPTLTEEGFMQGTRGGYLITIWMDAQGKDSTSMQVQAGKAMFTDGPTQQQLAQALLNGMVKKFDAYHQEAKSAPVAHRDSAPEATPVVHHGSAAQDAPAAAAATLTIPQAQARLNALGFAVGTPDGLIGPRTRAQLQAFQRSRGIPVSGALDSTTTAELLR